MKVLLFGPQGGAGRPAWRLLLPSYSSQQRARAQFGGTCGCPVIVSDPQMYGRQGEQLTKEKTRIADLAAQNTAVGDSGLWQSQLGFLNGLGSVSNHVNLPHLRSGGWQAGAKGELQLRRYKCDPRRITVKFKGNTCVRCSVRFIRASAPSITPTFVRSIARPTIAAKRRPGSFRRSTKSYTMNHRKQVGSDGCAAEVGTLRSVLMATGGQARIEGLYRPLNAEEAAHFLGLFESQVRQMTCRSELPCVQLSPNRVGYQLIELIDWLQARKAANGVLRLALLKQRSLGPSATAFGPCVTLFDTGSASEWF